MHELIKDLEIKTLMVYNLVFAIFMFLLFFLIIGLYFLISAVTAQIFIFTAEFEYQLKKQKQK